MEYCLAYFLIISAVSVFAAILDKHNSKHQKWRVSEKTLFLLAALGGALAMYAIMRLIHHKTRHKRFMIGLPIIIVLHLILAFLLWNLLTF